MSGMGRQLPGDRGRVALTGAIIRGIVYLVLLVPPTIFLLHAFATRWFYPQLWPREWSLAALRRQLGDPQTSASLATSVIVAALVTALSLVIAYPAARTIGLRRLRGGGIFELLFLLPTTVPTVAIGMGLNIFALRIGLAGTLLGVVLAQLIPVLPYTFFALVGVFARYDPNYEYQALALGAAHPRVFFRVTLPLILPGVVVATLLAFLVSWSQYLLTLLIGGGRIQTLPLLLFAAAAGGNTTSIAVLALFFILPPLVVIVFAARYLTSRSTVIEGQY